MFSWRIDPKTLDHVIDSRGTWEHDDGLGTSVHLALRTERGSHVPDPRFGSRFHLLRRENLLPGIDKVAVGYALEALKPFVADGRLQELTVKADREASTNWLALEITGVDASGRQRTFRERVQVGA